MSAVAFVSRVRAENSEVQRVWGSVNDWVTLQIKLVDSWFLGFCIKSWGLQFAFNSSDDSRDGLNFSSHLTDKYLPMEIK